MPAITCNAPCFVCQNNFPVMHSHHTVPQCCGGKNSKQVILCASCHNSVHAHALHVYKSVKSNKSPVKQFWKTGDEEKRAKLLVQLIVDAFVKRNIDGMSGDQMVAAHFNLSARNYGKLKQLQQDAGLSSLDKTLAALIEQAYTLKGFDHVENKWYRT